MKTIATNAQAISPDDTAYLSKTGCVYVGTAGNINVLPIDAANTNDPNNGTIIKCPAGIVLPLHVKKVFTGTGATATTATDLVLFTEM